jgi:hypothetical protein
MRAASPQIPAALPSAKSLIDAVQEAWSPIRNKGMTTLRSDLPDVWPGGAISLI